MVEMKQFGLDIDLDDAVAQGHYSNLVLIAHSSSEFILDFATVLPGVSKAHVKSRIILTPEHAKRLLWSLQENIARYESSMGKIEIPTPNAGGDSGPRWGRPDPSPGRERARLLRSPEKPAAGRPDSR